MRRLLPGLLVLLSSVCLAQTTPPLGVSLLASDGNLYGLDASQGFFSYNLSTGVSTLLNANYVANSTTLCLEMANGTLLAINNPSSSSPTAISLTLAGVATTLATFPAGEIVCPAPANNGSYYGSSRTGGKYSHGYLYQLTSANVLTDFYDFTGAADGDAPNSIPIQASDGNLYFSQSYELLRYSATEGLGIMNMEYAVASSPLEGPSGDFYFTANYPISSFPEDSYLLRVTPAGATTVLYTNDEGIEFANLYLAANNFEIYNTYFEIVSSGECEASGYALAMNEVSASGANVGTVFSYGNAYTEVASGNFFLGGNGTFYGTLSTQVPQSDGDICNFTTTDNTVALTGGPSPMSMTLSKTHVLPGSAATLTWQVNNAYSDTMQQCYGYGGLSGAVATSGTTTVTAKTAGTNISAIVCGGTQTDFVNLNAAPPTVFLSTSADPAGIGLPITLTASLRNTGLPAPTGTVKFLYGSTVLGSANLVNGSASITESTSGLTPGTYNVTAIYSGDGNYSAATSQVLPLTLQNRTATTAVLSPASQTLISGSNAAFTATVTGSSSYGNPTRSVELLYGPSVLLTQALSEKSATESTASLSAATTGVPPGVYSLKFSYPGDEYNLPSTSNSATVTVLKETVSVAATPNPVPATSSFTLTATATGSKATPTGTVVFSVGSQDLGSNTLNSNGVASITLPEGTLAAGTYSITAYYAGDSNNLAATSPAISLMVE